MAPLSGRYTTIGVSVAAAAAEEEFKTLVRLLKYLVMRSEFERNMAEIHIYSTGLIANAVPCTEPTAPFSLSF